MMIVRASPLVYPSKTPDTILKASFSTLAVEIRPWGLRSDKALEILSSFTFIPAGRLKIVAPIASPWEAPKILSLILFPQISAI